MNNLYHATPYDISASGFYFKTYEEYCKKAAAHHNEYVGPVEEYEMQFIDGDNYELFSALNVNQANLISSRSLPLSIETQKQNLSFLLLSN